MEYTLIFANNLHLVDDKNAIVASANRISDQVPNITPDKETILWMWEEAKLQKLAEQKYPLLDIPIDNPSRTSVALNDQQRLLRSQFIAGYKTNSAKYTENAMEAAHQAGAVFAYGKKEVLSTDRIENFQQFIDGFDEPTSIQVEIEMTGGEELELTRVNPDEHKVKMVPKITNNCVTVTKVIVT